MGAARQVPLPPKDVDLCESLAETVDWAEAHPVAARRIAGAGRELMRDAVSMEAVYSYMAEALGAASRLLGYAPASAVGPSNASRVPPDAASFRRWLRNDTTYPIHAQITAADWAAVVQDFDYSRMGLGFQDSARAHEALVKELKANETRRVAEERKAQAAAATGRAANAARASRGKGRGWARGRGGWGRGRSRWALDGSRARGRLQL